MATNQRQLISFIAKVDTESARRRDRHVHRLTVTIKNLTDGPVWYCYRDFKFVGRTSCGVHEVSNALAAGEEKQSHLLFKIGRCADLENLRRAREYVVDLHGAALPQRAPRQLLQQDLDVAYSYQIDAWDVYPNAVHCWGPPFTAKCCGVMTVPAGIGLNFCVHHQAKSFV